MKLLRTARRLTVKDKLNIVFAVYSSLSDLSQRRVGPSAVAKRLNIDQPTVSLFLKRFEMSGKDINSLAVRITSKGRPVTVIGSKEIEEYLLSTDCLNNWAHLSILQRCEKIWQDFKVRIKRHKLQLFYKRNNIRWKISYTKFYPHGHDLTLLQAKRIEFAMEICDAIFNKR